MLLTTQYLDEADQLADDIVVIDHGKAIAAGTPDQLKSMIGDRLDVELADLAQVELAKGILATLTGSVPTTTEQGRISLPIATGSVGLADVVRHLDKAGASAADVAVRRPTLDEVFLQLTEVA